MEQLALHINAVIVILVYGVITGICAHTLWTRHTMWLAAAFLHLAGWISVVVVLIYTLNLAGFLPSPLPAVVGRNIVVATGGAIGLAAWIIRNVLTRPR